MAEKIRELEIQGLQQKIRYIVRYATEYEQTTHTVHGEELPTVRRLTKPVVVVFVTDLFRAMSYARPTKSASAMINRAGRTAIRRSATIKGVTHNVVGIQDAVAMVMSSTRDIPSIKVALVDALRSVGDAHI